MVWPIAWLSGIVALGVLVAVHLARDTSGSALFKVGQVVPAAIVSTVVVAGLAYATSDARRWPWPVITLSVFALAGVWYCGIAVLPQVVDDASADTAGQADRSLTTPRQAGEWTRMDGPAALQRRGDALTRLRTTNPAMRKGVADYAYAEYRHPSGAALAFFGLEAMGVVEDELRDSTKTAVEAWATTLGAQDLQFVEAGNLAGSMACTDAGPGLAAETAICVWADASTIGQITVAQPGLSIDTAAAVARDLRAHVTSR